MLIIFTSIKNFMIQTFLLVYIFFACVNFARFFHRYNIDIYLTRTEFFSGNISPDFIFAIFIIFWRKIPKILENCIGSHLLSYSLNFVLWLAIKIADYHMEYTLCWLVSKVIVQIFIENKMFLMLLWVYIYTGQAEKLAWPRWESNPRPLEY